MTAHRKLYRTIGIILIFIFLQAQSCDLTVMAIFGIDNPDEINCVDVQITSLKHSETGQVDMSWNQLGEWYDIRLYYQDEQIAHYNYSLPTNTASFTIDWESLQGTSNEVTLEFSADSFYTPGECIIRRTLDRPSVPVVATSMNCANLRLTSPLGGMSNGMQTFYWDALEGAVSYRINVYDNLDSTSPLAGWDAGNALNLTVDVSVAAIGGESPLMVELIATDGAGSACAQRYEIAREAAPPAASATPTCAENPSASYC